MKREAMLGSPDEVRGSLLGANVVHGGGLQALRFQEGDCEKRSGDMQTDSDPGAAKTEEEGHYSNDSLRIQRVNMSSEASGWSYGTM